MSSAGGSFGGLPRTQLEPRHPRGDPNGLAPAPGGCAPCRNAPSPGTSPAPLARRPPPRLRGGAPSSPRRRKPGPNITGAAASSAQAASAGQRPGGPGRRGARRGGAEGPAGPAESRRLGARPWAARVFTRGAEQRVKEIVAEPGARAEGSHRPEAQALVGSSAPAAPPGRHPSGRRGSDSEAVTARGARRRCVAAIGPAWAWRTWRALCPESGSSSLLVTCCCFFLLFGFFVCLFCVGFFSRPPFPETILESPARAPPG